MDRSSLQLSIIMLEYVTAIQDEFALLPSTVAVVVKTASSAELIARGVIDSLGG
jgi:hypothetical protein